MSATIYSGSSHVSLIHSDPPGLPTGATGATGNPTGATSTTGATSATGATGATGLPAITIESINSAKMLIFAGYCDVNRYDRYQALTTTPVTGGSVSMLTLNMASGGSSLALGAMTVTITLTPIAGGPVVTLAPFTPVVTANSFSVPIPGTIAPGWYRLSASVAGWSTPTWYVLAAKAGMAAPTQVPVVMATYDFLHPGQAPDPYVTPFIGNHMHTVVPAVFAPTTVPCVAPPGTVFTTTPNRTTLVETRMAIARADDVYRPAMTAANEMVGTTLGARIPGAAGVMTCFNRQPYFYSDVIDGTVTRLGLLDGPRGQGTVVAPLHLQVGHNGGVYFTDCWRVGRVSLDGTVTTIVGTKHTTTPTLWTDRPQATTLVGDWSRVTGPHYLNEVWGMAWDKRRLVIDPNSPLVNGLHTHVPGPNGEGPTMYLPDRNNNRIVKVVFSPVDASVVPVVNEFLTGLGQPWECVTDDTNPSLLYVGERAANRIAVYDMDTKALVDQWPAANPEGLFIQDGFIHYGSITMGVLRKRNIATKVDTVFCTPPFDGNSNFLKFALSDGTFGPRGMVGTVTWSNTQYSYPVLFLPNGTKVSDSVFPGQPTGGPGLPWQTSPYPTAVAFGLGRMVCGTVQEGLRVQSLAQPTDTNLATAAYTAGAAEYRGAGYHLTNGPSGFGYFGLPLPWGKSSNIDTFLAAHGHVKG